MTPKYFDEDWNEHDCEVLESNGGLRYVRDVETGEESYRYDFMVDEAPA